MKVDIGESIMLSWLRHEKNCQLVQLNWKPSINTWELSNEKALEYIMKETDLIFTEKYNMDLFKKNSSYLQLIQQGELDAIGTEIKDGIQNIYGIDVAFHENGLQYGPKEKTVARVLKKLVRSAMIIYGFFNVSKANIIFASPSVHKATYQLLIPCIEELNDFFATLNLSYEFSLIINNDFEEEVFNKVLDHQNSISDTSELFMRSMQLYNLFGQKNDVSLENELNDGNEEKVGNFVRRKLDELIMQGLLTDEEIDNLKDLKYSKDAFGINYEFFREIENGEAVNNRRIIKGYSRYYSKPYNINERKLILCNQWFDRNRDNFYAWVKQIELLNNK